MKRQAKINKNLNTAKNLVANKIEKAKQLKKQIAYLEMRENTGTKNKHSLTELMNKVYNINDIGQVITAGGAIDGE